MGVEVTRDASQPTDVPEVLGPIQEALILGGDAGLECDAILDQTTTGHHGEVIVRVARRTLLSMTRFEAAGSEEAYLALWLRVIEDIKVIESRGEDLVIAAPFWIRNVRHMREGLWKATQSSSQQALADSTKRRSIVNRLIDLERSIFNAWVDAARLAIPEHFESRPDHIKRMQRRVCLRATASGHLSPAAWSSRSSAIRAVEQISRQMELNPSTQSAFLAALNGEDYSYDPASPIHAVDEPTGRDDHVQNAIATTSAVIENEGLNAVREARREKSLSVGGQG